MHPGTDWLADFLPLLRCPATRQPLRLATAAEKLRAGLASDAQALSSEDGSHLYIIDDGIPILLPGTSMPSQASPQPRFADDTAAGPS